MNQIPTQVSKSVRKRNPHLYGGPDFLKDLAEPLIYDKPAKRIRQSSKPVLNKLEQEWFEWLLRCYSTEIVFPQAIRFKLGNGIWYKPDFVTFGPLGVCAFEVKGPFSHRGGFENLKVAASKYTKITWTLVWKEQGQWKEQIVLP